MSDTYVFVADPSHAWLRVPHTDLLTAGVAEHISPYSYIDPDFVYLEEDCDALLFITAMKVEPRQITEEYRASTAIRTLPVFSLEAFCQLTHPDNGGSFDAP